MAAGQFSARMPNAQVHSTTPKRKQSAKEGGPPIRKEWNSSFTDPMVGFEIRTATGETRSLLVAKAVYSPAGDNEVG